MSPFYGSFSYSIPIEVPPFHGISPNLALGYSSEGRNGIVGVGWGLAGFSSIERVNSGLGTPGFTSSDVFTLDGQELVACAGGSVSPSCTSGGTHSTKIESYVKIKRETAANKWFVWGKDGTKTEFSPTLTVTAGTLRWGQTSITDTKNNQMSFTWTCADGDCYPATIAYNGYTITVFRETRPDRQSFAAYNSVNNTIYRIRSIVVRGSGGAAIRAYKLTYTTSAVTGRSLLTAVQKFGKDVVVDAAGAISGGTSLPPMTFTYQNDTIGKSFVSTSADPPTGPTTEPVTWVNMVNVVPVTGNSLNKTAGGNDWNAGAVSHRAIASGDGYMEFRATANNEKKLAGLSNGDTDQGFSDVDFGWYEWLSGQIYATENGNYYGPWPVAYNDLLRVEVQGGVVRFKKNGVTLRTSPIAPTYPLRVDTSIFTSGATIPNVMISGSLTDLGYWCQGTLLSGDFNGDGRSDQYCYDTNPGVGGGRVRVALATGSGTGSGFSAPTTWLTSTFNRSVLNDFNRDGKTDLAILSGTVVTVALSTGTSFQTPVSWGSMNNNCANSGQTAFGTGDFNGDGLPDVSCRVLGGENYTWIGISGGSGFAFQNWGGLSCGYQEVTGSLDWNGDGKDDWYCIGLDYNQLYVFLSSGTTFQYPSFEINDCTGAHVLADLNGDGRTDVQCSANGRVKLSTGAIYQNRGDYGSWCPVNGQHFAADVDGDGASELLCSANNQITVRKWKDNALAPAEVWATGMCTAQVVTGDFNGDNKTDLLCRMKAAPLAVAGTGGFQSDLIKEAFNGLGGSTELTYTTSANFANANGPPPKYTVATSTTKDGRGNNATTSYTYSGGYMDWWERRFLGFGYVKQTLPCIDGETACPYIETWLRQDLASAGKPSTIKRRDGSGNVLTTMTYEYLTNGSTVPRTSVLSGEWTHIYSGSTGECSTWPCSQGKRVYTQHQYDAYGNRIRTWLYGDNDAGNDETTTAWDFYPNTTAYIVGKPGRQQQFAGIGLTGQKLTETRFHYDGGGWSTPPTQGYVTQVANWLNTNGSYPAKTFSYDNWGNQVSATDETSRTVTSTYDSTYHEFPTSTSNAAGETELFQWDALCGRPSQRTDVNGQVTTFQTDALCRPTLTTLPLGAFELRSYVGIGNPATQHTRVESPSPSPEDGSGNHWARQYFDGLGRTYRTSSKGPGAQAIETETTHTLRGQVRTTTAPFYAGDVEQTTTYSYDGFDRPIAVTHPDSHQITKSYGLLSTTTADEHGHESTSRTDVYGHPTASEQELAGQTLETQYTHDLLGRMTSMMDPLGNSWSWTLDSLGRNVQRSDPDAGVWAFTFDVAGRPTTQTDAKAQQTTFTYDNVGRLATKSNSAGTVTFTRSEPRSGYYNVGQVTTVSSPGTSLKIDYDALGRPVRLARNMLGYDFPALRRYDARGHLKGITYPDNDEIGTTTNPLRYDAAGRLKLIPGIVTNVQYDAAGRPLQQTNANGTVTTRTYSPERGFLTGISTSGSSTIQNLSYDIDPAGLAEAVTSPFANESWTYGYDALHRMTSSLSPSNPNESQTFQYDAIGRITYNSRVGYYTYPPGGSPRPHAPIDVAGGAMTYDANGNLLSGQNRTFTWNADNLPTQINTTQFAYDGLGERIQKTAGSTTVVYPLGDDFEVVNGTTLTKYVSVGGLGVVAKRVGVAPSVTTYWLHADRLGSIQAITNASGALVQRRTYRPYGAKIADSTSHAEARGWIQQRTDPETNLAYLHARYYDPSLGVFLSPDPVNPLDAFNYGFGDPVNSLDPSGLDPKRPIPSFPVEVVACAPVPRPGCPNYDTFIGNFGHGIDGWWWVPPGPETGHGFEHNFLGRLAERIDRQGDRRSERLAGNEQGAGTDVSDSGQGGGIDTLDVLNTMDPSLGLAAVAAALISPFTTEQAKLEALTTFVTNVVTTLTAGAVLGVATSKFSKTGALVTGKAASGRSRWPNSADEMDDLLGIRGTRVPDGPMTPGRGKVEWRPNEFTKITFERHPYHPNAPEWHRGPHWHLDTPGNQHRRYLPGDPIPGKQ